MSIMKHNEGRIAKTDIKSSMTKRQLRQLAIGRRLAKLIHLDGMTQTAAIMKVFPHLNRASAGQNGTRICNTYKVTQCLLDMLPSELPDDMFEKLMSILTFKAINTQDEKLMLEVTDRHAKFKAKYKAEVPTGNVGEEYLKRVERARKLIAEKGILEGDIET